MNSKIKYLYLVIGLLIGIAIGGSCVWWIQNYDLKIWFSFSGKKQQMQSGNELGPDSLSASDKTKTITLNNTNKKGDYLKRDASSKDSLTDNSNSKIHNNDSLKIKRSDEDIVVIGDELIYTKNFKVEGVADNISSVHDAVLDSLLIDDRRTKHLPANIIHVEFWKSPVNYKGYKFVDHKLVLFGIYQFDFATFEYKNGNLFLSYLNNYYRIDKTDDYKQLLSVKKPIKQNKN